MLSDILLRYATHPSLTTKGADLTWLELDDNFIEIYDYLIGIASSFAANFEAYDSGSAYSLTSPDTFVSYTGNVYRCIAPSPVTGVAPDSDPASWELVSSGLFAHVQNSDTILDEGGPNEVDSAQIVRLFSSMTDKSIPVWRSATKRYEDSVIAQDTLSGLPALILKGSASGFVTALSGSTQYLNRLQNLGGSLGALWELLFQSPTVAAPGTQSQLNVAFAAFGFNHTVGGTTEQLIRTYDSLLEIYHKTGITIASPVINLYAGSSASSFPVSGFARLAISEYGVSVGPGAIFSIYEGTPGSTLIGQATLSAGSVTINLPVDPAGGRIFVTCQALGTVTSPKALAVLNKTPTSFDIVSSDPTDTSTVDWVFIGNQF